MSETVIAPADIKTLADLRQRLGEIPVERIWFHPAPGTATEKDAVAAEARENRLCELVDGTLVQKAMGLRRRVWPASSCIMCDLISLRTTWESAWERTA